MTAPSVVVGGQYALAGAYPPAAIYFPSDNRHLYGEPVHGWDTYRFQERLWDRPIAGDVVFATPSDSDSLVRLGQPNAVAVWKWGEGEPEFDRWTLNNM